MVAATPTPGCGCSGRSRDASEISFGVQRHIAAFRRFFTRRHVTSFQSADMSAHSKPSTTRVAQKRKPGAYATLSSASAEAKTCREAVRFPS